MENCGRLSSTEKTRTIQFLWVYVSIRKQTKNTGSTAINYGRCGDAIIRDLLVKSASKPTKVKRKKTADVRSTRARHSMLRCRATKIVQSCLQKMEKSIEMCIHGYYSVCTKAWKHPLSIDHLCLVGEAIEKKKKGGRCIPILNKVALLQQL